MIASLKFQLWHMFSDLWSVAFRSSSTRDASLENPIASCDTVVLLSKSTLTKRELLYNFLFQGEEKAKGIQIRPFYVMNEDKKNLSRDVHYG